MSWRKLGVGASVLAVLLGTLQFSATADYTPADVEDVRRLLLDFKRDGFMVLKSALSDFSVHACRTYFEEILWAKERWLRPKVRLTLTKPGVYSGNHSLWLRMASAHVRNTPYRLPNVPSLPVPNPWHDIVHDSDLLKIIQALIGGPVQHISGGLVFEKGTQQGLHEDTWYSLGSETPGGMVGVWFALEDVDMDNGPLLYLRGSHRNRPEDILNPGEDRINRLSLVNDTQRDTMYRKAEHWLPHTVPFLARAGDVGIWHERLLHGGAKIQDWSRTRLSLVVHYRVDSLGQSEAAEDE